MKQLAMLCLLVFTVFSCHNKTARPAPKGEFAFLLQYNKRKPEDVGFLSNHVVQRRVANLLKDSFQVFMSKTKYSVPIYVDTLNKKVSCAFYSDSALTIPSAYILVDITRDALWVDYVNGDPTTGEVIVRFADNPSIKTPDPFLD